MLKVVRDDKEQTVSVTLANEPEHHARGPEATPEQSGAFLGVFTQPLKEDMKEHLRLKTDKGALIADTIAIVSTIDPVLGDVDR